MTDDISLPLDAGREQLAAAEQKIAQGRALIDEGERERVVIHDQLRALLPVETPQPAPPTPPRERRTRVAVSDKRAAVIRDMATDFLAGAKSPVPTAKIVDHLLEAGVLKKREFAAVEAALTNSSLILIEGEGYLPAGSVPLAQAAE